MRTFSSKSEDASSSVPESESLSVLLCAFCENLFISNLQLLTKLMLQKTLLTLQKSRKLLFVLSASEKLF